MHGAWLLLRIHTAASDQSYLDHFETLVYLVCVCEALIPNFNRSNLRMIQLRGILGQSCGLRLIFDTRSNPE